MRPFLFRASSSMMIAATFFCISCEEHHVGEYPEVQRDRLAEAKAARNDHGRAPAATATPANFFPENKSP